MGLELDAATPQTVSNDDPDACRIDCSTPERSLGQKKVILFLRNDLDPAKGYAPDR